MHTNDLSTRDFLTVPQVAERLQLSRVRVYGMARNGSLPSVRIGNSVRIPRPALERWVNGLGGQGQQQVIRR